MGAKIILKLGGAEKWLQVVCRFIGYKRKTIGVDSTYFGGFWCVGEGEIWYAIEFDFDTI